jgi:hypothetical protein
MRLAGFILILIAAMTAGGCSNPTQPLANDGAALSSDPANGNLAPADQAAAVTPVSQTNTASAPYPSGTYNPVPPPPAYSASSGPSAEQTGSAGYDTTAYDQYDQGSGEQVIQTFEPPPPLPEYSQPSCPGDNYIWTPGYWNYAASGYYWVPGVWVVAPYVGALWTPPYWGFYESRYRWHHGFWGTHIGFYGGIDYGFGYTGRGYSGGYWRGNEFEYNRSVNNINVNVVRNVYSYPVRSAFGNSRVSYNGGRGGLNVRPTAPEIAVLHEQRMAPVPAQVAHVRQAEGNREQFAAVNHGRPAEPALPQPLRTEYSAPAPHPGAVPGHPRVIAPVARPEARNQPSPDIRAQVRPGEPMPNRPQPMQAQPPRPEAQPFHPQTQPLRPEAARQQPFHPAPQPSFTPSPQARTPEARPMPARPMEAPRPQPAPRMEAPRAQSAPQPRPAEAPRPQPAARVEAPRPAPAPHMEPPHPAPSHGEPPAHPEKK